MVRFFTDIIDSGRDMIRSLLVTLLLLSSSLHAVNANSNIKTILVLGDSLSAAYGINIDYGWVSLLQNRLTQEKQPYRVINASISGDTSIGGLNRLPLLLNQYQPEIVIVELGGNDGLRGLPVKTLKHNLQKIIELSLENNSQVILAGIKIPPNYGMRYTEMFYQVYTQLENEYPIVLIPFLLDGIGDNVELMQADGLHPTKQAQSTILEIVWKKLNPLLINQ